VEGNTGRVDVDKVDFILSQRVEAKRAGDFPTADRLRDQLRKQLGVEVMDRERHWWCSHCEGGAQHVFKGGSHDYTRTDDLPGVNVEQIDQMLAQRLQARLTHDFITADDMRAQLRAMGVEIDDKSRTWTANHLAQQPGYGGFEDERDERRGGSRRGEDGGGDDDDDDDAKDAYISGVADNGDGHD